MKRVIMAIALLVIPGVIFVACGGGGGGGGGGSTTPPGTVPTVLSVFPVDGADQVSTNTDISITFSEAMDRTSVQSNTSITSVAGTFSTVSYSWEALDTKIVMSPTAAMVDSTRYVVAISSQTLDAEGDSMAAAYMFSFTTGSVPTGLFTHPFDGETNVAVATTVGVQFSEPMDIQSVKDSFGFMGASYAGTLTFIWTNGDQDLAVSFNPQLSSGVTYIATLLPGAEDIQGTSMESFDKITFATGSTLATGSISGVITDDPDSSFDDSLGETFVALFDHNFMDTQGPNPTITQSDVSGAYSFSYLNPGLYYLMALQETNGDGELGGDDLTSGDSMGFYSDITQLSAAFDSVSVAAVAVTGIDFTLLDTEAIIGDVSYAGANTTLAYSSNAYIGAFTSTDISAMSGTPPYSAVAWNTDNFDPGTNLWD
ncbi:MAG: Ig-like domain-containing protein, partial [bacterium]